MAIKHVNIQEEDEKRAIREYFDNTPNGVFIEVGANDSTSVFSQTWHLENRLKWSGLLVEPIAELAEAAAKLRKASVVEQCVCTSPNKTGTVPFFIPVLDGKEISSHASCEMNADDHDYSNHHQYQVSATTLTELLEKHSITNIDFLSIDVEGTEYDVLMGLDFRRFSPRLILLEDKHLFLRTHRFLKKEGYRLARRLNCNCWYIRNGEKMPIEPLSKRIKLFKRMYISIWYRKLIYAIRHQTIYPFMHI